MFVFLALELLRFVGFLPARPSAFSRSLISGLLTRGSPSLCFAKLLHDAQLSVLEQSASALLELVRKSLSGGAGASSDALTRGLRSTLRLLLPPDRLVVRFATCSYALLPFTLPSIRLMVRSLTADVFSPRVSVACPDPATRQGGTVGLMGDQRKSRHRVRPRGREAGALCGSATARAGCGLLAVNVRRHVPGSRAADRGLMVAVEVAEQVAPSTRSCRWRLAREATDPADALGEAAACESAAVLVVGSSRQREHRLHPRGVPAAWSMVCPARSRSRRRASPPR